MFILGLFFGPFVGVLAGDLMFRRHLVPPAAAAALIAVGYAFLVAVQFLDLELRVGFAAGLSLGLILAATPMEISPHPSP
jgi:uncharacterized protein YqgC (DUF456 family)